MLFKSRLSSCVGPLRRVVTHTTAGALVRRNNSGVIAKVETALWNRALPATRALQMFYACKEQCDNTDTWHSLGKIPNNFHGKHGLLLIHIWMLNKRLLRLPETSARAETQELLFDTLWMDTQARIRAAGITEISVMARLKDVQNWSLPTFLELDHAVALLAAHEQVATDGEVGRAKLHGLMLQTAATPAVPAASEAVRAYTRTEVEAEVVERISGTLWRQIYQRGAMLPDSGEGAVAPTQEDAAAVADATIDDETEKVITSMATYIMCEYRSLMDDIGDEDFTQMLFRFGRVPRKFLSGTDRDSEASAADIIRRTRRVPNSWDVGVARDRDSLAVARDRGDLDEGDHGSDSGDALWRSTMHVDGKLYYWNRRTFESQWQEPTAEQQQNRTEEEKKDREDGI